MSTKPKQQTPTTTKQPTPAIAPAVAKPKPKEQVERKEKRVVEGSGEGQGWIPAEVYVGDNADRSLLEQRLLARFRSRAWAVRLTVNGMPVNHSQKHIRRAVAFHYRFGDDSAAAVVRFMDAVERAAAQSWEGPTWLFVDWYGGLPREVEGWLTELLDAGPALVWPDGTSPRLCRGNFIVSLYFNLGNFCDWERVARIVVGGGGQ